MPPPLRRGRVDRRIADNVVRHSIGRQSERDQRVNPWEDGFEPYPSRRPPHYEDDPFWTGREEMRDRERERERDPYRREYRDDRPHPPISNPRGSWGGRGRRGNNSRPDRKPVSQAEPPLVMSGIPHLESSFVTPKHAGNTHEDRRERTWEEMQRRELELLNEERKRREMVEEERRRLEKERQASQELEERHRREEEIKQREEERRRWEETQQRRPDERQIDVERMRWEEERRRQGERPRLEGGRGEQRSEDEARRWQSQQAEAAATPPFQPQANEPPPPSQNTAQATNINPEVDQFVASFRHPPPDVSQPPPIIAQTGAQNANSNMTQSPQNPIPNVQQGNQNPNLSSQQPSDANQYPSNGSGNVDPTSGQSTFVPTPHVELVNPSVLQEETERYYDELGKGKKGKKSLSASQVAKIMKGYKSSEETKKMDEQKKKEAEVKANEQQAEIETAWSMLHHYWQFVRDNPYDFNGWTYLLSHVETMDNLEAARSAFDGFLPLYPYCFAYWKKLSDIEKKHKNIKRSVGILMLGVESVPYCMNLWVPLLKTFISYVNEFNLPQELVKEFYEGGLESVGLAWQSSGLWDACINHELDGGDLMAVMRLYRRLARTPLKLYNKHWDHFLALIRDHHPRNLLSVEEYQKLRRQSCKQLGLKYTPTSLVPPKTILKTPQPEDKLTSLIKEKIVVSYIKVHEKNEKEVEMRWKFEERIKRPYFHMKSLDRKQIKNWNEYLDFELGKGDPVRIVTLFERSLLACALYEEFWIRYALYMEKHAQDVMDGIYKEEEKEEEDVIMEVEVVAETECTENLVAEIKSDESGTKESKEKVAAVTKSEKREQKEKERAAKKDAEAKNQEIVLTEREKEVQKRIEIELRKAAEMKTKESEERERKEREMAARKTAEAESKEKAMREKRERAEQKKREMEEKAAETKIKENAMREKREREEQHKREVKDKEDAETKIKESAMVEDKETAETKIKESAMKEKRERAEQKKREGDDKKDAETKIKESAMKEKTERTGEKRLETELSKSKESEKGERKKRTAETKVKESALKENKVATESAGSEGVPVADEKKASETKTKEIAPAPKGIEKGEMKKEEEVELKKLAQTEIRASEPKESKAKVVVDPRKTAKTKIKENVKKESKEKELAPKIMAAETKVKANEKIETEERKGDEKVKESKENVEQRKKDKMDKGMHVKESKKDESREKTNEGDGKAKETLEKAKETYEKAKDKSESQEKKVEQRKSAKKAKETKAKKESADEQVKDVEINEKEMEKHAKKMEKQKEDKHVKKDEKKMEKDKSEKDEKKMEKDKPEKDVEQRKSVEKEKVRKGKESNEKETENDKKRKENEKPEIKEKDNMISVEKASEKKTKDNENQEKIDEKQERVDRKTKNSESETPVRKSRRIAKKLGENEGETVMLEKPKAARKRDTQKAKTDCDEKVEGSSRKEAKKNAEKKKGTEKVKDEVDELMDTAETQIDNTKSTTPMEVVHKETESVSSSEKDIPSEIAQSVVSGIESAKSEHKETESISSSEKDMPSEIAQSVVSGIESAKSEHASSSQSVEKESGVDMDVGTEVDVEGDIVGDMNVDASETTNEEVIVKGVNDEMVVDAPVVAGTEVYVDVIDGRGSKDLNISEIPDSGAQNNDDAKDKTVDSAIPCVDLPDSQNKDIEMATEAPESENFEMVSETVNVESDNVISENAEVVPESASVECGTGSHISEPHSVEQLGTAIPVPVADVPNQGEFSAALAAEPPQTDLCGQSSICESSEQVSYEGIGKFEGSTSVEIRNETDDNVEQNDHVDQSVYVASAPTEQGAYVTDDSNVDSSTNVTNEPNVDQSTYVTNEPNVDQSAYVTNEPNVDQSAYVTNEPNVDQSAYVTNEPNVDQSAYVTNEPNVDQSAHVTNEPSVDQSAYITNEPNVDQSAYVTNEPNVDSSANNITNESNVDQSAYVSTVPTEQGAYVTNEYNVEQSAYVTNDPSVDPSVYVASAYKAEQVPYAPPTLDQVKYELCAALSLNERVLKCPPLTPKWIKHGVSWEDVRHVYRRGAWIHCPNKPKLLMHWAEFEEMQGNLDTCRELLRTVTVKHPSLLQARMQLIELECRVGNHSRVEELYVEASRAITITRERSWLAIRFARFLFKILLEPDRALVVLRKALKKDRGNMHLYHHVFDICYQRQPLDNQGVMASVLLAMASKDLSLQSKHWFAHKRVEFLREHGDIVELKRAQHEQMELKREADNEEKKKKEAEKEKATVKEEGAEKCEDNKDKPAEGGEAGTAEANPNASSETTTTTTATATTTTATTTTATTATTTSDPNQQFPVPYFAADGAITYNPMVGYGYGHSVANPMLPTAQEVVGGNDYNANLQAWETLQGLSKPGDVPVGPERYREYFQLLDCGYPAHLRDKQTEELNIPFKVNIDHLRRRPGETSNSGALPPPHLPPPDLSQPPPNSATPATSAPAPGPAPAPANTPLLPPPLPPQTFSRPPPFSSGGPPGLLPLPHPPFPPGQHDSPHPPGERPLPPLNNRGPFFGDRPIFGKRRMPGEFGSGRDEPPYKSSRHPDEFDQSLQYRPEYDTNYTSSPGPSAPPSHRATLDHHHGQANPTYAQHLRERWEERVGEGSRSSPELSRFNEINRYSIRDPGAMDVPLSKELELQDHHSMGGGRPVSVNVPEWLMREGGELKLSETEAGTAFIRYWPNFMTEKGEKTVFTILRKSLKWHQRRGLGDDGQWQNLPHLLSWVGPCAYNYSGVTLDKNTNWLPEIVDLLHRLIKYTENQYNSCFLTLYRNGYDHVPWTQETHPALRRDPSIATVSLGATRIFEMRRKNGHGFLRFPLFPGSLLLMEGATQEDWEHQYPKEPKVLGERVQMTFRKMYMIEGLTV